MASQDDMLADHLRTWNGFCRLMTAVVIGVAVLLGVLGLTLL